MKIELRLATLEDLNFLLHCRNDQETRIASHSTLEVTKKEHKEWLSNLLNDSDRTLYIAEENGIQVGTARADLIKGKTMVSWTVSPNKRGSGRGKKILALLSSKINGPICAEVKNNNLASIKLAESIGMELEKESNGILYFIKNNNTE